MRRRRNRGYAVRPLVAWPNCCGFSLARSLRKAVWPTRGDADIELRVAFAVFGSQRDLVGRERDRSERDATCRPAGVVVVGGDWGEGSEGIARIDGERRVVMAALGIDHDGGGRGRDPRPPQRAARRCIGLRRLERFCRGAAIVGAQRQVGSGQDSTRREIVVEWAIGGRLQRIQ
jgi:hypothetical protein